MFAPLKVFCCYAREDLKMLEYLKKHLTLLQRSDHITVWSDTNLNAGVEWKKELHQQLESADIILLLISPDFMCSDYCYNTEMKRAMERHKQRSAVVIPILLCATVWDDAPFAKLHALPKDAKPVKSWLDIDEAFKNVVEGIKATIEDLRVRGKFSTTSSLSLADERFSNIPEAFYERIRRNISKGTGAVIVKVDRSQEGEEYYLLPDKAKILLSGSSNWQRSCCRGVAIGKAWCREVMSDLR